jgi:hypothetical protein
MAIFTEQCFLVYVCFCFTWSICLVGKVIATGYMLLKEKRFRIEEAYFDR